MAPAAAARHRHDDVDLSVLRQRVDDHDDRLDGGTERMNRIDDKIDRILMLQYGAVISAVVTLLVVILRAKT